MLQKSILVITNSCHKHRLKLLLSILILALFGLTTLWFKLELVQPSHHDSSLLQMVSDNHLAPFEDKINQYKQQIEKQSKLKHIFEHSNFPIISSAAHQHAGQVYKQPHTYYELMSDEIQLELLQALGAAINYRRIEMIQALLTLDVPVDDLALRSAIKLGLIEVIPTLIEQAYLDKTIITKTIIAAIASNQLAVLHLLDQHQLSLADIDLSCPDLRERFYIELAQTSAAIFNHVSDLSYSPLKYLSALEISQFLAQLSQHPQPQDAIIIMQTLLEDGLAVDHYNQFTYTPLITAILLGDIDLVRKMTFAGVDINTQCQQGIDSCNTPLWHAIYSGHFEIAHWLIDHGADVNQLNANGMTLLEQITDNNLLSETLLEQQQREKVKQLLISHGAH